MGRGGNAIGFMLLNFVLGNPYNPFITGTPRHCHFVEEAPATQLAAQ